VSLDIGASDRSTDAVGMTDGRLGRGAWPAGQLPPATGGPLPASAARSTSAVGQPGLGGLLLSFGDALGGQQLAQPGVLVVHIRFLPAAQRPCFSA
jgi:hypothetical protein